jgi:hypothetical protein
MDWINKRIFNLLGKGPHPLLGTGLRAARVKITVSGVPYRLKCCALFMLYIININQIM